MIYANAKFPSTSTIWAPNWYAWLSFPGAICPAGIKKLMSEEIIKKDDTVVGILTGRQKDAMIPVDYHNNSENTFANPPKN